MMIRSLRSHLLSGIIMLLLAARAVYAQGGIKISPPEIYPGDNEITISSPNGIRDISVSTTRLTSIEGAGPAPCTNERRIRIRLNSATEAAQLAVTIMECNGRRSSLIIPSSTTWNVDHVNYGTIEVGSNACREFQIRAQDRSIILDSITVNDPRVTIRLPGTLPVTLRNGVVYRYRVCLRADVPGNYKFPVNTWIRRTYPSAGLGTYPVADTGVARAIPPVPDVPDTVVPPPPRRQPEPEPIAEIETPIHDPTTFRTIAVPNAVIPKKGRAFVGDYDLLGLTAGYSISDNLMLIAGGAVPTPDDWGGIHGDMFGAYSIGAKAGLRLAPDLDVAIGYQWGTSTFDQEATAELDSRITVNAPYMAVSYGTDDSRFSVTGGYVFKHHVKPGLEFDQNALLIALGGDMRLARHWKLAGEIVTIESLGVVPMIGSARYFTGRWAVDLGLAYVGLTTGDTAPPKIPLVPVVSAVVVF